MTRHLVARCRCGTLEAFDLGRLACCQRNLPISAIAPKLRCVCGSRQIELTPTEIPAARRDPSRVILWYA